MYSCKITKVIIIGIAVLYVHRVYRDISYILSYVYHVIVYFCSRTVHTGSMNTLGNTNCQIGGGGIWALPIGANLCCYTSAQNAVICCRI